MYKILPLLWLITFSLFAQTDSTETIIFKKVLLKDGEFFEGYIVNQDSQNVFLKRIDSVVIKIPQRLVKRISETEGILIDSTFFKKDRNESRLFFAQTGKSLRGGEVIFNISEIFFPFINVGVTDFASISGGISLFPTFGDQFFYIAPKIKFLDIDKYSLSANLLYMNNFRNNKSGFGLGYTSFTATYPKAALTFGLGFSYNNEDISERPFVLIGFAFKTGTSSKIISENWIIQGELPNLFSIGFRTYSSNLAWDFGFIIPASEHGGVFIPWLGIAYSFGYNK